MSNLPSNPWGGSAYISTGYLRNALTIASKNGMKHLSVKGSANVDITSPSFRTSEERLDNCSSMQQISLLRQISRLDQEYMQLEKELQMRTSKKDVADLMYSDMLETLIYIIEDLSSHLQMIISNKDILIGRLQETHGDFIEVDSPYQKKLVDCFPLMAKQLADLTSDLDNIIWMGVFSLQDGKLANTCENLSSKLAVTQSYYQALNQSRRLMKERLENGGPPLRSLPPPRSPSPRRGRSPHAR